MAGGIGRRHLVLLFSVLAGLFLMHGISAGGVGGCHGVASEVVASHPMRTMQPDRAMSAQLAEPANPAESAKPTMPGAPGDRTRPQTAIGVPDPASAHHRAGETCVPLRPEGLSGLFLALFLIVITLWRHRLPHPARLIRPHWPHGPPRTGAVILRTLSISRT